MKRCTRDTAECISVRFPKGSCNTPRITLAAILVFGLATGATAQNVSDPSQNRDYSSESREDGISDVNNDEDEDEDPEPAGTSILGPLQTQALEQAARRGDSVVVESIVVAAIARDPENASRIIEEAVRIAPKQSGLIVDAVENVFPNLRGRADVTAREELKRQTPPKEMAMRPQAIEPGRDISRDERWSGNLSLGGSYRSGATESIGVNFGAEIVRATDEWRNSASFSFDYDKSRGSTNVHRFQSRAKTERPVTDRLYGFGLLSYRDDRFSGFEYQLTESAGVGYRLFDTGNLAWDLEVGPSWRQSRITRTDEFVTDIFLRAGNDIKWNISDTTVLSNETSLLYNGDAVEVESTSGVGFQDSNEVKNTTSLNTVVIGSVVAEFSTEFSYSSDPPPGGTKTDTLSKISLNYNF